MWDESVYKKKTADLFPHSRTASSYLSINDVREAEKANKLTSEPTERTKLLAKEDIDNGGTGHAEGQRTGKPSLIRALVKVFFVPVFKTQAVGIWADALLFLNPILLR